MSRTRKIWFVMAIAFVVVIAVFVGVERLRGSRALESWRQDKRKNGEPITVAEILAPLVLPKDNAAEGLLAAAQKAESGPNNILQPRAAMLVAPDKAGVSTRMKEWPESVGKAPPRDAWPEFAKTVAESEDALALVYQAMEREQLDFGLDYSQGFELRLPHLAKLKGLAMLLKEHAQNDLHRGDSDRAFKHLELGLRLVQMQTPEYLIISQLVRIAETHIIWEACWEGLQHHKWSEAQLAALQAAWEKVEFAGPMERSFSFERAVNLVLFDRMRNSSSEVLKVIAGRGGAPFSASPSVRWSGDMADFLLQVWQALPIKLIQTGSRVFYIPLWQVAWSYQDEARFARLYDQYVEKARTLKDQGYMSSPGAAGPNESDVVYFANTTGESTRSVYHRARFLLSDFLGPSLDSAVNKVARTETLKQLTIAAIALERHRLAKGSLPDNLAELVPTWLSKLPIDPMDGETLRYQKMENGEFLLYSVGTDGKDDQGDGRQPGQETVRRTSYALWNRKDFVWPMAASEEETLEFLRARRN